MTKQENMIKVVIRCTGVFILVFLLCFGANMLKAEAVTIEEKFPEMASGILKSAKLVSMKPETLLKSGDIEIQTADLDKVLEQIPEDMRKQLKQNLFFLLEQEAGKKILVREAKSAGISSEGRKHIEIIQTYLTQKTNGLSVTDAEAQTFYDNNKEMVGDMPFDKVKENIKAFMLNQKKQDAVIGYLSTLGDNTGIQVNQDWTESQYKIMRDNPVDKARASGKQTMVEFGATGCVPCDMMQPILDNLRKKFGDRLNVVFINVKENQFLGARFGIRSIPIQVFYDKDGKEAFRHTGYYAEADVLKQLEKIGLK